MTTKKIALGTTQKSDNVQKSQSSNPAQENQKNILTVATAERNDFEPKSPKELAGEAIKELERLKNYYLEMSDRINRLAKIEKKIEELESHRDGNNDSKEPFNMFKEEENNYLLRLESKKDSYRREEVFELNNPLLIDEILCLLIYRLKAKAEQLKLEIAA